MNNPFEAINNRLTSIENILQELKLAKDANTQVKKERDDEMLGVKQASELLNLAVPTIYALTSNRTLPHSKRGKKLYFQKAELIEWVKSARRKTVSELKLESSKR